MEKREKKKREKCILHINQPNGKSRMREYYIRTLINLLCGSAETACLDVRKLEIEYRHRKKGRTGELVGVHCWESVEHALSRIL